MKRIYTLAFASLAAVLTGCGGGSGGDTSSPSTSAAQAPSDPASASAADAAASAASSASAVSGTATAGVAAAGSTSGTSGTLATGSSRAVATDLASTSTPSFDSTESATRGEAAPTARIASATAAYTPTVNLPSLVTISSITPSTPVVPNSNAKQAATTSSSFTKAYYVNSVSGSDANPGTQDKPWKTLAKAASAKLNAGEALLLSCEGKWREAPVEFGTAFAPAGNVLVGGYGTCSHARRPIIYGSTAIANTSWLPVRSTAHGAVYVASAGGNVVAVARGEKVLTRARFPNATSNTHLSLSKAGNTTTKLVLSEADRLAVGSQPLKGSTAVVRSAPWQTEAVTVSGYDADTGTITTTAMVRTPPTGSGYFLEGQAWMLDTDGEWYHDVPNGLLYVFMAAAPAAGDPAVEVMEATTPLSFRGIPKLRVEQLAVINAGEHGLRVLESGDATISNIVAQRIRMNGVHVQSTTNKASAQKVTIESSTLRDIGATGIATWLSGTKVLSNTISNVGTQVSNVSPIAAIKISETQSVVRGNVINGTGFNAISLRNRPEVEISHNTITNACSRLTDCAGIYSWDNSGSSTARSTINHNSVYHINSPALLGAVGGSPDLLVGIYIDESTNNMDVTNNNVGNVSVGINVHKAVSNVVSGNIINVASAAGIRVESSGAYANSVRSNRIEGNTIFVPRYYLPASEAGAIPKSVGGIVMDFAHQSDVLKLLIGTDKTTAAGNVTVHLGDTPSMRYRLRSGATTRELLPAEWNASYGPSDTYVTPYRAEMAKITGEQLIKDSGINFGTPTWTSYSYQKGASIVSFGADSACGSSCAALTPATTNDVLMQAALPVSDFAKKLMFVRYRVIAKGSNTASKVEVRSNVPPHIEAGYLEPSVLLPANSERRSESFFKRTVDSDLRISVKGQVGSTLYLDDVQLYVVDAYYLTNPLSLGRVLSNMGTTSESITCANLGLTNCSVVDQQGNELAWPIVLPAGSNKIFFLRSADWRYQ